MLAMLMNKLLCKLLNMLNRLKQLSKHGNIPKAGNSLTSISFAEQAEKGAKYDGQTTEYAELG